MQPIVLLQAAAFGLVSETAPALQAQSLPRYQADVNWPRALPERWVLGGLCGHCINAKDHVLILDRQDVFDGDLHGGQLAPPVIELEREPRAAHPEIHAGQSIAPA